MRTSIQTTSGYGNPRKWSLKSDSGNVAWHEVKSYRHGLIIAREYWQAASREFRHLNISRGAYYIQGGLLWILHGDQYLPFRGPAAANKNRLPLP